MTFPIAIASSNGHFTATVLGSPHLRAHGATRDQALEHLKSLLAEQVRSGELTILEVEAPGILAVAGKYADDPTLREICEEAYRSRDAERPE
jgi:hypothetical protein